MTRRERLERKLELRREWAEKRQQKAESAATQAVKMLECIPMGQPILVGHHSERGHRALLARSDGAMRRASESYDMAKHHAGCAGEIERALDRSIFSDDPDAIEAIEAKIAKLEAEREQNNGINRVIRSKPKNEPTPEKIAQLVALGASESQAAELFKPDFCGRFGIPSYVNQNLGGNIGRLRERIKDITRRQERAKAAETSGGVSIEGTDFVAVTFAEKPERSILDALKAAGFHWSGGSWCGYRAKLPACVTEGGAS